MPVALLAGSPWECALEGRAIGTLANGANCGCARIVERATGPSYAAGAMADESGGRVADGNRPVISAARSRRRYGRRTRRENIETPLVSVMNQRRRVPTTSRGWHRTRPHLCMYERMQADLISALQERGG